VDAALPVREREANERLRDALKMRRDTGTLDLIADVAGWYGTPGT